MPRPSSPHRRLAWGALALAPLLLAPMSLPAESEEAFVPTRSPGGWARFSDSSEAIVDQNAEPGLAQLPDGTLVAAWRQMFGGSGVASLVTTTVPPDNSVSAPVAQLTWPNTDNGSGLQSGFNRDPEVLRHPGGAEVIFVGSDGGTGEFAARNAYRLLVDGAGQASAPDGVRYFAEGAGYDVPLDATRRADGEVVVQQLRRWHVGPASPSETEDLHYESAPWPMYSASIASIGDVTYLGHFTAGGGVADSDRGIHVGPLVTTPQTAGKLPESWYADNDHPVALEASTTGKLWSAYCTGIEACERMVLHDVLGGQTLTVPTGEYASRVVLAPGPEGRMWVVWQSGSAAISAVRTNKAVTRFGPVRRSAPFYTVNSIRSLVADGRFGPADVLVNGREAVWHRRYLPSLAATARPTRWKINRRQTVAFSVNDAGDPVSGAAVGVAGRTCATGAAGSCSITVPARSTPTTLTATVTRSGYLPANVTLSVVR